MAVAVDFRTIPEMFQKITAKFASEDRPVIMYKKEGRYQGIRYSELKSRVEIFACGLAALGLKRGDRVSIISENRPEWVISDLAAVTLGGITVPIYPTMSAKQNEFILNDAGVRFVIVSNKFQLNKVMKILGEVKNLEGVIIMNDHEAPSSPEIRTFGSVAGLGEIFDRENPGYVQSSVGMVKPDDLLTLIYTSGTTGNPKGVMLTNRNLASNMISAADAIPLGPTEIMLSFLPLCHSFERMAGYYTGMACGSTIAYAESIETFRENMVEVRPTVITTVPRLFERMHSRILKQVEGGSALEKRIFSWSVRVGHEYALAIKSGKVGAGLRAQRAIADRLVFRKLRERCGGRMKFFISGGAALSREFGEFFEAAGLSIMEGYGLTETSPVISVNRLNNYKFGSVGQAISGIEIKIADDGEILTRGPNIMRGYWNNPVATAEVIDAQGWLHTGDIGRIDDEGFLYITDRKKHLFVSSGGKNIAPQPIESLFLSNRYIDQFMLIGDRRMFLAALIVPDIEALKEFAKKSGITWQNNEELVKHPAINSLLDQQIANLQKDLAHFERVRKFTLLDRPFTIEDGELTPTQKVRRKVIEQKYSAVIEKMYEGIH